MNNEGYETYLIRKYSVAVALAIIKTKPRHLTSKEYINELKAKLDSHSDLFQDIFISESDFATSDDEQSDLNKDENAKRQPNILENDNTRNKTVFNILQSSKDKNGSDGHSHRLDSVSEVVDVSEADFNDSISILKDIAIGKANPTQEEVGNDYIKEILDIFKDTDTSRKNEGLITTSTPKQDTQSTLCETPQINFGDNLNINSKVVLNAVPHDPYVDNNNNNALTNNVRDSQETELYTLYGYTDNFTYISQSQDNITVPMNLIHNGQNRLNTTHQNDEESKSKPANGNNEVTRIVQYNIHSKHEHNVKEKHISDITFDDNINISKIDIVKAISSNVVSNDHDTVEKRTSSSDEYSFLFTDATKNERNKKSSQEKSHNKNIFKSFSGSFDYNTFTSISFLGDTEASSCRSEFLNKHLGNKQVNSIHNAEIEKNSGKETRSFNLSDSQFLFLNSNEGLSKNNEFNVDNEVSATLNPKLHEQVNTEKHICKCAQYESGYETQCTSKNDRVFDDQNEMENKSDTDGIDKMVTFKIFEELNRIKNYIGRQDRRLSDSGRSNSQGSQLSGVRINESGFCLLNYIMEYPLVGRTMEITEEVSQVLGKFVDKLHEEENYPQFLEKLLEKVQDILTDIYEANRVEDLLKKEEQMNRVLLLNRSKNITMYTIEKMLPILDDVFAMLQQNDFMETTNLGKLENLCYVFHLLEILLKRHNAAASSQTNTQMSQDDDKGLKRSTITEIWRKKWNLSKSDVSEGSFKKKCALTQISEVLNRIIVKGMDGYSLISFAALQCFNLLQSK